MRYALTTLFCSSIFAVQAAIACPTVSEPLSLQAEFADPDRHKVHRQGIWAVWYDPAVFDHSDAKVTADGLDAARCRALTVNKMVDPPSARAGLYTNIYLHDPEADDGLDDAFGNGVGTNAFDMPFMTLPLGAHADRANLSHEGFHIFQYSASSPGFAYDGDSAWYIETTAEWFALQDNPTREDAYATVGGIAAMPHLALWQSWDRGQPGDPEHWMLQTRQYGMHQFLQYLVETAGLSPATVTQDFFTGTRALPQQVIAAAIGHDQMAHSWADYAAMLTASTIDGQGSPMPGWLMTTAQRDYALAERDWALEDDPLAGGIAPVSAQIDLAVSAGDWVSPPRSLRPRPWGYNVVSLINMDGAYQVTLDVYDPATMPLRLIVRRGSEWQLARIASGSMLDLTGADAAYIIVANTPEVYRGHATRAYQLRLD